MSAPQLEPQPIGQRPNIRMSNPAEANRQLRQMQRIDFSSPNSSNPSNNRPNKRSHEEMESESNNESPPIYNQQNSVSTLDEEEENDPNDKVRLWEEGWRERYYKNKFNVGKDDLEEFRIQVAQHYARGLCWVLQYYYQGVPAWDWYFPYHYAPFASDFINIKDLSVLFDNTTKPFKPLEQLMSVFPSQSKKFLPIEWQSLMTTKESPIIDFYPLNFCVDLNGKRHQWQGVALLPFVDEKRLHRTLEHVYSTLTVEEQQRNKRDYDRLYIHSSNLCYDYFKEIYIPGGNKVTRKSPLDMPTMLSEGMAGRIWPDDDDNIKPIGEQVKPPLPNCEDIIDNQIVSVKYRDLAYEDDYIFKAKLLENVTLPAATLRPRDYDQRTPYRPNLGFAQRPQYQRDFAPAQRFIRHSMGSHQNYQQQNDQQPNDQQQNYQQQNYRQRNYQQQNDRQQNYQQRNYQQQNYQQQNYRQQNDRQQNYQQRNYQQQNYRQQNYQQQNYQQANDQQQDDQQQNDQQQNDQQQNYRQQNYQRPYRGGSRMPSRGGWF